MIEIKDPMPRIASAELTVELVCGQSAAVAAGASNPLKLLVPRARGTSVWAYLSNHGGGLVAGDQTRVDVTIGASARCFLGTQSSTKVYRNPDKLPCAHALRARILKGGILVAAPDPVQCFAQSIYDQRQEFRLQTGAGLVLLDGFASGRAARGEIWAFSRYASRTEIWIDDRLAFLDSTLLTPEEGAMDACVRMGRFHCAASLVVVGEPFESAVPGLLNHFAAQRISQLAPVLFAASPIRHGVVVRVAGGSVEAVRGWLQPRLEFLNEWLGDDPWARKW